MSETPHVRALFGTLLRLQAEDAALPLQVLVNLHRAQLRAPMERLALVSAYDQGVLTAEVGDLVDRELTDHYPMLNGGQLWADNPAYMAALRDQCARRATMTNSRLGGLLRDQDYNLRELIVRANDNFRPYEPLVQLYLLTLPTQLFDAHLELLEAALAAHSVVREMVLAVATAP